MSEADKKDTVEVTKEAQITEGLALEPGDRIQIVKAEEENLRENFNYYLSELEKNLPVGEYPIKVKVGESKYMDLNRDFVEALNSFYNEHVSKLY